MRKIEVGDIVAPDEETPELEVIVCELSSITNHRGETVDTVFVKGKNGYTNEFAIEDVKLVKTVQQRKIEKVIEVLSSRLDKQCYCDKCILNRAKRIVKALDNMDKKDRDMGDNK